MLDGGQPPIAVIKTLLFLCLRDNVKFYARNFYFIF